MLDRVRVPWTLWSVTAPARGVWVSYFIHETLHPCFVDCESLAVLDMEDRKISGEAIKHFDET